MVIPACKNAVASSSRVEAELPEWFGFSPSPSLEPAIDNEDNENTPRKRAKISNPATQVAVDTLWVSLLLMRTKMHGVLRFLTEFQPVPKSPRLTWHLSRRRWRRWRWSWKGCKEFHSTCI